MLKRNLIANFIGKGWQAFIQLLFVPYYVKLMGVEAYGLVGLFGLLVTLGCFFETGLSSTMNRELSRFLALNAPAEAFRNFVRTLETTYWIICLLVGGLILASSSAIAHHWLNVKLLDLQSVEYSIALMGVCFVVQLPLGMYQNGLQGLQRQMTMNLFSAGLVTLRAVGGVLVLLYVNSSPVLFFAWQASMSLVHTLILRMLLWKEVPKSLQRARFDKTYLLGGRKFASAVTALGILGILILHLDKIILSRILPLEEFGYYSVAVSIASGLLVVTYPMFAAIFPAYSYVVALKDEERMIKLYHQSTQLMSIFILPLMLLLTFFSYEILLLWTGSEIIASKAYRAVAFLAIGTGVNAIMHIPYALQLAHGWLKLSLYQSCFSLVSLVILLPLMIRWWGVDGAAAMWCAINLSTLLVSGYFLHRKFLMQERTRWYLYDILMPALGSVGVMLLGQLALSQEISRLAMLFYLILLTGITFVVALLCASFPRNWVFEKLKGLKTGTGTL